VNQQFNYWEVLSGDQIVETVYPGQTFKVLKAYADVKVTLWTNTSGDSTSTIKDNVHTIIKEATYTVTLRANYGPKEKPQTTMVKYCPDESSSDRDCRDSETIIVNDKYIIL
jgi:PKD repeat protein